MSNFILYIIFSLTTSIVGLIQIYLPVQKKLKNTHKNDVVTKAPFLGYFIFFIFANILAPIMLFVLVDKNRTTNFINNIYSGITNNI